jgi:hypothetical protein
MKGHTTNDIFQELDRTYKTVLDFVHEVQDALEDDAEFDLYGFAKLTKSTSLRVRKTLSRRVRASVDSKKDAERSSQTNRQS